MAWKTEKECPVTDSDRAGHSHSEGHIMAEPRVTLEISPGEARAIGKALNAIEMLAVGHSPRTTEEWRNQGTLIRAIFEVLHDTNYSAPGGLKERLQLSCGTQEVGIMMSPEWEQDFEDGFDPTTDGTINLAGIWEVTFALHYRDNNARYGPERAALIAGVAADEAAAACYAELCRRGAEFSEETEASAEVANKTESSPC